MDMILQVGVTGVVLGAIYGMAALGFTIVFNATRIINFANGDFLMMGGLCLAGGVASMHLPTIGALAGAVVATAALGAMIQAVVLDGARMRDHLSLVMLTIGASVTLRGVASVVFGRDIRFVPDFGLIPPLLLGNIHVPAQGIWIVLALAFTSLALWFIFQRTRMGKAMQAASQEPHAAALCGIEPRRMAMFAFVLAAALGGLAGAFVAPIAPAFYENGIFFGLKGFAAAIVGGLGNPLGALLGGLLIGIVESVAAGYGASGYKDAIAFLLLVLVLIVRPAGLIGRPLVTRV
jgi:branched-chain amino acid transport system permease protein